MALPKPANDLSNWRGRERYVLRCPCSSFEFVVIILDGRSRLVCSRCEHDMTDALY